MRSSFKTVCQYNKAKYNLVHNYQICNLLTRYAKTLVASRSSSLSLLRIPFESEFELRRELPLELMRSNETGCDPNHKQARPDRDQKTLRCIDPETTAYGPPRKHW